MLVRLSQPLPPEEREAELVRIERMLVPLSMQAPYTLLTMRVFGIGLPLLACCISLLLVFYYGLTEARSGEIRKLLALRREGAELGLRIRSSTRDQRHERHESTRTHVLASPTVARCIASRSIPSASVRRLPRCSRARRPTSSCASAAARALTRRFWVRRVLRACT